MKNDLPLIVYRRVWKAQVSDPKNTRSVTSSSLNNIHPFILVLMLLIVCD